MILWCAKRYWATKTQDMPNFTDFTGLFAQVNRCRESLTNLNGMSVYAVLFWLRSDFTGLCAHVNTYRESLTNLNGMSVCSALLHVCIAWGLTLLALSPKSNTVIQKIIGETKCQICNLWCFIAHMQHAQVLTLVCWTLMGVSGAFFVCIRV